MRLVLCDDHRLFLDALSTALSAHGHDVQALVSKPDEIVPAVVAAAPDAVLLDVWFPSASGIDVIGELREAAPAAKILVLSGTDEARTMSAAFEAGAMGFVRKDERVGVILRALDRLAAGELVYDADLLRLSMRASADNSSGHDLLRQLTPREREILRRIIRGENTQQMVDGLGIAASTARAHVQSVLMKLGVHSRLQAVARVVDLGLDKQI